jgi:hypothetical protein
MDHRLSFEAGAFDHGAGDQFVFPDETKVTCLLGSKYPKEAVIAIFLLTRKFISDRSPCVHTALGGKQPCNMFDSAAPGCRFPKFAWGP